MYSFGNGFAYTSPSGNNVMNTFYMSNGKIQTHATSSANSVDYTAGTWYRIKIIADLDKKTFDFYVDDELIQSDLGIKNSSYALQRFLLFSSQNGASDMSVDYFRVCEGEPYDRDDVNLDGVKINETEATRNGDSYTITLDDAKTTSVTILPETYSIFASATIDGEAIPDSGYELTLTDASTTKEIVVTSEDGTTTKTYTVTVTRPSYKVIWKNGEDTIETDENVVYGATPEYNGIAPTKEADAQYTYTFDGWQINGEGTVYNTTAGEGVSVFETVTGDVTYVAHFTESAREYDITYNLNGHGTAPTGEYLKYTAGTAKALPALTDDNCDFGGWYTDDTTFENAASITNDTRGNQVVYAKWTAKTYAVSAATGLANGSISVDKSTASLNDTITVTIMPDSGYQLASLTVGDKEVTGEALTNAVSINSYTFTMPAKAVEVSATFEEIPANTYTITIDSNITNGTVTTNPSGSATKGQTVTINIAPNSGYQLKADSVKVNNGEVAVTDNTFTMPEGNVTVTAEFEQIKYTITWNDVSGNLIDTTTVAYGETPTHANPTKAATAEFTYTFTGWTPTIAEATANATYTAIFNSIKRKYTITWDIDGEKTSEELEYGATPTHAAPTKPEDANGKYSFTGWSPAIETVTKAQTYTAQFDTIAKYTITYNTDGGQINDDNYPRKYYAGEGVALPSDVTKDNYYFTGWYDNAEFNGEPVTSITASDNGNKEYWAQWTQGTPTEYLITFVNWDNTELQKSNVAVGVTPKYTGTSPTKPEDSRYTYEFTGWTPEIVPVSGIATYKAEFKQLVKPIDNNIKVEKVMDNGVKLVVTPTSGMTTINLYVAIYNADGSLKSVGMTPCTVSGESKIIVPMTEPQLAGGKTYKLMLWDAEQSPLITAITSSEHFFN